MEKNRFVAIGHIVDDIEPTHHLGGGVSYSAVAAARLGIPATIITKCPADHPYIAELTSYGIDVVVLPSKKNTITSFSNIYDTRGRRTQKVLGQQESITATDIETVSKEMFKDATILVAPVVGEVDMDLFSVLAKKGTLAITPQGYFRHIESNGSVRQKPWSGFRQYLPHADIVIFSEEDVSIDGVVNKTLLEDIKKAVKITILTRAENGATIFAYGTSLHIPAFSLKSIEIKDFTGAGDTFATSFIISYIQSHNLAKAGSAACLFSALKIMGFGGIGIDSIPKKEQIDAFIENNRERVEEYLEKNNVVLDHPNLIFK